MEPGLQLVRFSFPHRPQSSLLAAAPLILIISSFVSKPSGHIFVKMFDYDKWGKDHLLGEVNIPAKQLENGDPVEGWYVLENEPKKKKGPEKGEIRLKLHFPVANKVLEPLDLDRESLPRPRRWALRTGRHFPLSLGHSLFLQDLVFLPLLHFL